MQDAENYISMREKLLNDAKVYCAAHNISLSRLSTLVVNDGKFFDRIQKGGDCTTAIYERFQAHFQNAA